MMRLLSILLLSTLACSVCATDYERFQENGKVGLRDNKGQIILPATFDALGWSDGNFSVIGQITGYRQKNKWGLLNLKKEFITNADFETLTWPGGDRVIVSKAINPYTTKFGSIDLQGKVVIPFNYDEIILHGLRAIVMVKNGTRYEHGLIDLNDRSLLGVKYKSIVPIGSLRYAVENFSDKIALCTEEGKWITDFTIDKISEFHHDLATLYSEWRKGVIDRNGDLKIEPIYRDVIITSPEQVTLRKADEWRLLNDQYKTLQSVAADQILFDEGNFNRVIVDGKAGLVDKDFTLRWPLQYQYIGPIQNKQAVVKKNGKYGLLHLDQSPVVPIQFDSLCVDGYFIRTLERSAGRSSWNLYDTFGIRKTNSPYEFIGPYNGKFLPAKNRGYYGAIDRYGKERIACVYDALIDWNDSLIAVKFKGQYGIITQEDKWKVKPQRFSVHLLDERHFLEQQDSMIFLKDITGSVLYFTDNSLIREDDHLLEQLPDGTKKEVNFLGQIISRTEPITQQFKIEKSFRESEGLIGIRRDGKFGFVDSRGRLRIANRYEDIGEFHDGLAPVKLLGKWGYINAFDQIVIQPTYERAENFNKQVAQVWRKGKTGLISKDERIMLELSYDSIAQLPNQLYLLTLHAAKGLADNNGRILIEPRFESLEVINNGSVIVKQRNQYGLLSRDGLSLLPIQFSKLMFLPDRNVFLAEVKAVWETKVIK